MRVGIDAFMLPLNERLRVGDPRGERLGNRLLIGEAALGPLRLKLPVEISRQSHGCLDRRIGVHTTRSPNFGIFLQKGHRWPAREPCPSREQVQFFRGRLCSSIRTNWNLNIMFFNRTQSLMQGFCSEFGTRLRSNQSRSGISGALHGQVCDGLACWSAYASRVLGLSLCFMEIGRKVLKLQFHSAALIGDFAVLLLANRLYLLYKV